jgi:hypothetical protein
MTAAALLHARACRATWAGDTVGSIPTLTTTPGMKDRKKARPFLPFPCFPGYIEGVGSKNRPPSPVARARAPCKGSTPGTRHVKGGVLA